MVKYVHSKNKHSFFLAICECGNETTVRSDKLKDGSTRSCGCARTPRSIGRHGRRMSHGMTDTPLYYKWKGMLSRCTCKNVEQYKNYGARGIKVDWKNFISFYRDMSKSYYEHVKVYGSKNTSLDRIDVNRNYSKDNCRWVTNEIQQSNRRDNKYIFYNGEEFTVSSLARKHGLHPNVLFNRLYNEWELEKALKTPVREKKKKPTAH